MKPWQRNGIEQLLNCEEPNEIFYFNQDIREEQVCEGGNKIADKYIKKQ